MSIKKKLRNHGLQWRTYHLELLAFWGRNDRFVHGEEKQYRYGHRAFFTYISKKSKRGFFLVVLEHRKRRNADFAQTNVQKTAKSAHSFVQPGKSVQFTLPSFGTKGPLPKGLSPSAIFVTRKYWCVPLGR